MNKCIGCGIELQTENKETLGYTKDLEKKLCERCFRIKNYGEYKTVTKNNKEYIEILKEINNTKDLVVLVVDLFNYADIEMFNQYIKNNIILVLTKRDILPKSVKDEKLKDYFKNTKLNIIDTVIISSHKNYNFDELYEKINQNKKTNKVYVVGYTNAGKSTMINKLIYNYSNNTDEITTSILPSTTLNTIEVKINDNLNIIDTPGLIIENSYYDILTGKELKIIAPKKEIKPITYQIKEKQYIIMDKYAIIEAENINITIFMSNALKIERIYKEPLTKLKKHTENIDNCDIIINGLGFIKCVGIGKINIYTQDNVGIKTRKHLI